MTDSPITYLPIGIIRSDHHLPEEVPIQPVFAKGCAGRVEVARGFEEGLRDLEGFSHIYLICHLHRAEPPRLTVKPFLQDVAHGVFITRAPSRPNQIGMSIVELVRRDGNVLHLDGVDILDETPLLDIKPYTRRFDHIDSTRDGWMDQVDDTTASVRGRRDSVER